MPKFSAEALPLAGFLRDALVFCIPSYQREYTWGTREAGRLLDDVQTRIAAGDKDWTEPAGPAYFLGGIVLVRLDGNQTTSAESETFEIIDGQQRLVTLTILLAVLRDLATVDGDLDEAARLHGFIAAPDGAGAPFRLVLRPAGDGFFRTYVQTPGGCLLAPDDEELSDCKTCVLDNRTLYLNELGQLSASERRLVGDYLINQCWLVRVITDNVDSAFDIFTVLNFAGKPLTRSEILRARLLGAIASPEREVLNAQWAGLQKRLGGKVVDDLFSHIRTIFGRSTETVVEGNMAIAAERGGPAAYLREIFFPYAAHFERIRNAGDENRVEFAAIRPSLVYLGWLRHGEWIAPAMKWLATHGVAHRKTPAFFSALDRLSFALLLLGSGRAKRLERYRRLLNDIDSDRVFDGGSGALRLSSGEQANVLFNVSRDMHGRNKQVCRLLLLRLDDALGDRLTCNPPMNITIEHVLPHRPSRQGYWLEKFPDPDARDLARRRLANLVLVSKVRNDQARNKAFAEKKEICLPGGAPGRFALTNYLLECEDWTPEVIARREDELMAILKQMWDLKGPAGQELDR